MESIDGLWLYERLIPATAQRLALRLTAAGGHSETGPAARRVTETRRSQGRSESEVLEFHHRLRPTHRNYDHPDYYPDYRVSVRTDYYRNAHPQSAAADFAFTRTAPLVVKSVSCAARITKSCPLLPSGQTPLTVPGYKARAGMNHLLIEDRRDGAE